MEHVKLQSSRRTVLGKKVKHLRREGWIPAVVFGAKQDATPIQMEERELNAVLREAGSTALIELTIDQERQPHVVLARDIQRDILTSRLHHVDFYQVQLDRKVRTSPLLEIVGEAPAVRGGEAILVQNMNHIEVECLPGDLVDSIAVDVSVLETINDSITVADLPVPPGVTLMSDPTEVVVSVVVPRAAMEMEAEEAAAEAEAEVEIEGEEEEAEEEE
jgi:large subunit ribosomal protein L25